MLKHFNTVLGKIIVFTTKGPAKQAIARNLTQFYAIQIACNTSLKIWSAEYLVAAGFDVVLLKD